MAWKERVTRVTDGDTLETNRRKRSVRLANVNAPEKGKPGAREATKVLRDLIHGELVVVQTVARDKYGRAVANVRIGRRSVNKYMKELIQKRGRRRT